MRRPAPDIAALRRLRRPGGFALLPAAVAALGAAHVLIRTSAWGADVSHDPVVYLSTAVNAAGGAGLRDFEDENLLLWAPGYPLLLAAVDRLGIDLREAGRWINAAAFGLTILAAGLWLRRHVRSRLLALTATAAVAASAPLTAVSSSILTEPLFNLLTLLALLALGRFLRRGAVVPDLALAAGFAALAVATRYSGAVLMGAGVLLALLPAGAPRPLAARLRGAVFFGAATALALEAVLWRNAVSSGTLAGVRTFASRQPLSESPGQAADALAGWASPAHAPDWAAPLLWTAIGLVALACAAAVVRAAVRRAGAARRPSVPGLGPAAPFAVFVPAYLAFLVAVLPFTTVSGVHDRYLSPVYAPLLLLTAVLLDRLLSDGADGRIRAAARALAAAALAGAVLHTGFAAQASLAVTAAVRESGYGADSPNVALRDSPTLDWARAAGVADGPTWSNDHRLLWLAGMSAAPGRHRILPGSVELLIEWLEDGAGEAHLVWIDERRHGYSYGSHEYTGFDLRTLPGVETLAELPDGLVLRAARGEPFDAETYRARKAAATGRILSRIAAERGEPDVRARFDLYADPGGRTLTYVKAPCYPAGIGARFFLHVVSADPGDLPADRRLIGFDNLDFDFLERGSLSSAEGSCAATVDLPGYAIAGLRTGQWDGRQELWEAELSFGSLRPAGSAP